MNIFIKCYSGESLPSDSTIEQIIEINSLLVKKGCLKPYHAYESLKNFKDLLLPTLKANEKTLYAAFDSSTEDCVGFVTVGAGSTMTIGLIEIHPSLHRQGIGIQLIHYLQETDTSLVARVDSLCPENIEKLLQRCYFVKVKNSWVWKITKERGKELHDQTKVILQKFVDKNKNMSAKQYFRALDPIINELSQYSEKVDLLSSHPAYEHENKHKKRWNDFGVDSEFRINKLPPYEPFTAELNFEAIIKTKGYTKKEIIEIMKEVAIAAYDGTNKEKCKSDLELYEILSTF